MTTIYEPAAGADRAPGMMSGVVEGQNPWRPDGRIPTADDLRGRYGETLTVANLAEVADITEKTVRWYYQEGKAGIPQPTYVGRTPTWSPETAAAWLAARPGPGNWGKR